MQSIRKEVYTSLRINMKPENNQFEEESHLNQTLIFVFQPITFRGVYLTSLKRSKSCTVFFPFFLGCQVACVICLEKIFYVHFQKRQLQYFKFFLGQFRESVSIIQQLRNQKECLPRQNHQQLFILLAVSLGKICSPKGGNPHQTRNKKL